jgi:hypothetical protein
LHCRVELVIFRDERQKLSIDGVIFWRFISHLLLK